jgi:tetratricopeptide (TPR) repeat protein
MKRRCLAAVAVAISLALAHAPAPADALSDLPAPWVGRLAPIEQSDVSGAERLVREAIAEARQEVADRLAAPQPDAEALAGAYGRLGALFLLTEVEAQADACFRNAGALRPQEFRWPYYAGYLAMMAGNTDRALEYLQAAQRLDPGYPTLYLRLGKVRLDRSELAEARDAFERIAEESGLAAAAAYYLGQIANLERRHADAVVHLEKALAIDPGTTGAHYPLAQAYRALGKNELARQHLAQFEVKAPDAKDPLLEQLQGATKRSLPAFQRALHAVRQGDYPGAATRFAEGLAVDPDNAAARVSYARALYLAGRRDEAGVELARALEKDQDQTLAYFLRAVLLQAQGDEAAAAAAYRRTLALDPRHAGALFYLANLDFAAGRYGDAALGYRRTLGVDKDAAPARLLELVARKRAGEGEATVLPALSSLSTEQPDDPMLSHALARLLAGARDPQFRDPRRALEIATPLALAQPIPPHLRALALAQAAAGQHEKAAQTQRQAIAMALWMAPPDELAIMSAEAHAYGSSQLPAEPWPEGDPLFSPPPFDPLAPFKDYPAAVPY